MIKLKSLKEVWDETVLNEMPTYSKAPYSFKPVDDIGMDALNSRWIEIPVEDETFSKQGYKIFITTRKTMAVFGLPYESPKHLGKRLAVHTYVKLLPKHSYYQVKEVSTDDVEKIGRGRAFTLYASLIEHGLKLMSDNEQYSGAKPLWKNLSRTYQVEIYNELNDKVIIDKFDVTKHKDSDIWSDTYSKYHILLRIK